MRLIPIPSPDKIEGPFCIRTNGRTRSCPGAVIFTTLPRRTLVRMQPDTRQHAENHAPPRLSAVSLPRRAAQYDTRETARPIQNA